MHVIMPFQIRSDGPHHEVIRQGWSEVSDSRRAHEDMSCQSYLDVHIIFRMRAWAPFPQFSMYRNVEPHPEVAAHIVS